MKGTVTTTHLPTDYLATLAEAAEYVGVESADSMQSFLFAAHGIVDSPRSMTRRCFLHRTFQYEFRGWLPAGWCRYLPGGPVLQVTSVSYEVHSGMQVWGGRASVELRGDDALFGLGERPADALPGGRVALTVDSGPAEQEAATAAKRAVLDVTESLYRHPGLVMAEQANQSPLFQQFLTRWALSDMLPDGAIPWPSSH